MSGEFITCGKLAVAVGAFDGTGTSRRCRVAVHTGRDASGGSSAGGATARCCGTTASSALRRWLGVVMDELIDSETTETALIAGLGATAGVLSTGRHVWEWREAVWMRGAIRWEN